MRHLLHILTLILLAFTPVRAQEHDMLLPEQCVDECVQAFASPIDLSTPGAYEDNDHRTDHQFVRFSNPDPQNIAFDDDGENLYRKASRLSGHYEKFAPDYIIPWVATNPGRTFSLTATPDNTPDKGFKYTDLRFVLKTTSGHIELNTKKNNDGTYSVIIPGTVADNVTHVYAIARPADGQPFENVGRLKVACYERRTQKVVLVPLANNLTIDQTAVEKFLNSVYGKLGYTFSVQYDNDKSHTEGLENITSLNIGSGLLTQYSAEMKNVADTYIANISKSSDNIDKDAAYLFLMNSASEGKVAGIMPQKHPFGFIFMNGKTGNDEEMNRTIAHELGHGLWGLDHVFDRAYGIQQGTTTNLMDYTDRTPSTYLAHFQWNLISKPSYNWSLFTGDEGNEAKNETERENKVLTTAYQIFAKEKQNGRNIVYFTINEEYNQKRGKDNIGGIRTDILSLDYIPGQITLQGNSVSSIWFENQSKSEIADITSESINSTTENFKDIIEKGDFIIYETASGSTQLCEIPSASKAEVVKQGEALASHVRNNWQDCAQQAEAEQEDEQQIKSTLNALAQQFRSTQGVEYSVNGVAYRLNENGDLEKSTLSNEDINKGQFSGVDEIYRFEKNGKGIFQLSAYGINQSLTNVQGKAVDKEALAKYIKEHANKFFTENNVSSPEQKPIKSLDSDEFPDGDKVTIDKNAFFTKIISEAGGIGITFLKTSEVEPQVYYKDAKNLTGETRKDPIIHAPAVVTGVTEGAGQKVTDITSMCSMIYGVIVDKDERQKTIDGFVALKDQVADDPKTLFPLLGDVILASVSSSTLGDYEEMMDKNTDGGRSGHLKTRTVAGTTITAVEAVAGGSATMLPSISKKLAQKIRLQKWLKKIDLPDKIVTEAFTKAFDNLKDGSEAFLKDFENASKEVIREFVEDPDLVIQWNFIKEHHSIIAKDLESLKALKSIRGNKMAESLGFDDDFLKKISGTEGLAYKDIITSCDNFSKAVGNKLFTIDEAGFKKVLGNLMDGVDGSTSSRIKIKEIGAEWTFRHLGEHPEMYREKHLHFECVEHVGENGDKIRYVDMEAVAGKKTIFYEFKSVKNIPPEHFFDQFGKDLLNNKVDDLSQLKWIFDGKKVTQTQLTEKMKKAIKEWNIPDNVLKKWGYEGELDLFKKDKLYPNIDNIFKAE